MNNRFKEMRRKLGLTQEEAARRLGYGSRGVVVNIEARNYEIKPAMIDVICREFNVNKQWLLTGEGEMFKDTTKTAESIQWAVTNLAGEDTFKKRVLTILSELPESRWVEIEEFAKRLANKNEKG